MIKNIIHTACLEKLPKQSIWLIFILLVINLNVSAQHAIQFSQYFSNQLVINPAYAGADDALSLTMVHRNQWTGVSGSPNTTTLSGHTLFKNENTGLGINLFVDQINIHSNVSFSGIYSYRIKTGKFSYLSMGLQAGINHIKSDYASLSGGIHDPNDPSIGFQNIQETSFQFGTGVYFKHPRLELGLSAPILFSSGVHTFSDSLTGPSAIPHYFLFTRYNFDLSSRVRLSPGFLIKGRSGWPLAVDLNVDATINGVLMVGLSYRSFESLSTIIQLKILPQMKFGYSYDVPISQVQKRYFNSHEIMLNYIFQYKSHMIKSPR